MIPAPPRNPAPVPAGPNPRSTPHHLRARRPRPPREPPPVLLPSRGPWFTRSRLRALPAVAQFAPRVTTPTSPALPPCRKRFLPPPACPSPAQPAVPAQPSPALGHRTPALGGRYVPPAPSVSRAPSASSPEGMSVTLYTLFCAECHTHNKSLVSGCAPVRQPEVRAGPGGAGGGGEDRAVRGGRGRVRRCGRETRRSGHRSGEAVIAAG
jgi:hypothetical protein